MNKNSKIVIVTLCTIIFMLCLFITYDKLLPKDNNINNQISTKDNNDTEKSIKDIIGKYEYAAERTSNEAPNSTYTLNLYENGIFKYTASKGGQVGIIGNYVVDNNQLKLNYIFLTGSDVSLNPLKGTSVLTINEDGSIIGTVKDYFTTSSQITVTFKQSSKTSDELNLNEFMCGTLYDGTLEECQKIDSPM